MAGGAQWRCLPAATSRGLPVGACTPIERLRAGDVATVVGQVRCFDEPQLLAPLSQRRCAYYRTRLFDKADGEIVLAAVNKDVRSLQYASDEMKANIDVVLMAR